MIPFFISGGAAALLVAIALFQGLFSLIANLWRSFRGRPVHWNREALYRSGVVAGLVTVSIALSALNEYGNVPLTPNYVVLGCLLTVTPAWYLVSAYRKRHSGFSTLSYLVGLLSLFAMPVTATLITHGWLAGRAWVTGDSRPLHDFSLLYSDYFKQLSPDDISSCDVLLGLHPVPYDHGVWYEAGPAGEQQPVEPAPTLRDTAEHITFWFDQSLRGALFDSIDVFDCRISAYTNDTHNIGFSAAVVVYRFFSEIILVAIIVLPLAAFRRQRAQADTG